MANNIVIKGARQHNLKNVSLTIPKDKLVVMTGVSGSGKSSLAFDTIYAEGQRRYVESLSAYARQFLGIMDKPDVDTIEGLSPAISIDQKTTSHNPRSTVGTITEIYDYLRLLFARAGHPHCPNCHIEISKRSIDEIVQLSLDLIKKQVATDPIPPHTVRLLSPVVRQKKGEFRDLFQNLQAKGFTNIMVDGKPFDMTGDIGLIKTNKHDISVVIDEIKVSHANLKDEVYVGNLRSRLTNDIEQSLSLAGGLVIVKTDSDDHLFSERFSCPNCNLSLPELEPRMFSFNSPLGACETCRGIGTIYKVDPELVLNRNLTIHEGAILPFNKLLFQDTWYIRLLKEVAKEEGINMDEAIKDMDEDMLKILLFGTKKTYRVPGTNRHGKATVIYEKYDGIIHELERRFFDNQSGAESHDIQRYVREEICNTCLGKRLKPEILAVTIGSNSIADFADWAIVDILTYFSDKLPTILNDYEKEVARAITKEIGTRLTFLVNVGLGYLTISRSARSLSGGELQRIRLASQIGTGLTGVLYVLDEPSIGLHPKDVSALISTLQHLKELGNTLIVVEHDQETIESADHIVELGPQAGKHGGEVIFQGTVAEMKKSPKSLTGAYLSGKKQITADLPPSDNKEGELIIRKASEHNLKNVDVTLPLGNLIAVTGVSGSGKSTLIVDTLYPSLKYHIDGYYTDSMGALERLEGFQYIDRVYLVDQSPIGRTPRSNPATYVGFFDVIRDLFASTQEAKARGYAKGRFSFNVKGGRCEKCQGAGLIKIEMQFLPDVYVTCDVCDGHRYNRETLEVRYKGKNIYDILKMTVEESCDFFENHFQIHQKLIFLKEVGLGYIELGQAAPTLSGGEAQRIKLANELSRRDRGRTIYILDEPTTGLHFHDVEKLLVSLQELVKKGNTVIVIEHNLDVIRNCQYVVDMGPDGGHAGGSVMYQGPIAGLESVTASHTARYVFASK